MNRRPVVEVCIPMRDAHGLTRHLVRALAKDRGHDLVRVYDNGSVTESARRWLAAVEAGRFHRTEVVRWGPARGIYAMWNDAIRRAVDRWHTLNPHPQHEAERPVFLAILNNDLEVVPGFLGHLADALLEHRDAGVWITYPDWPLGWDAELRLDGTVRRTTGTRNAGGMSGYAFMIDVGRWARGEVDLIDEGYIWLAGDGDLVVKVQRAGGTAAAVVGLPVGHLEKASSERHPWTLEQGRADMRRSRLPGMHNASPGG